jgi:hypothetical protein
MSYSNYRNLIQPAVEESVIILLCGQRVAMTSSSSPPPQLKFDPLRFVRRVKISDEERRQRIAEAAYLRAASRQFAPGHEAEDWLIAEEEVNMQLAGPANRLAGG